MRCGPGLKQPIGIIHKNVVWLWIEVDFEGQPVNQGRIDEITLTILVKLLQLIINVFSPE